MVGRKADGSCVLCSREWWRNFSNTPKGVIAKRRNHLRRKYDMTLEDFDSLVEKQNGRCAICRKEFTNTIYVDHRHSDGKIRGLLDAGCNTMVAGLENPLRAAGDKYLEAG